MDNSRNIRGCTYIFADEDSSRWPKEAEGNGFDEATALSEKAEVRRKENGVSWSLKYMQWIKETKWVCMCWSAWMISHRFTETGVD